MKFDLADGQHLEIHVNHLTPKKLQDGVSEHIPTEVVEEFTKVQDSCRALTYCRIYRVDGEEKTVVGTGKARTHENDQFRRSRGSAIAIERALSHINMSKAERTRLWEKYWNGRYSRLNTRRRRGPRAMTAAQISA